MRLVVTRPQDDSERTAAALRALGHRVLIAPLLRIEPVPAGLHGAWGGVIVTSANAVNAIAGKTEGEALHALPLFAVGRRSAEAARAVGFSGVVSADGDVRDLIQMIAARRAQVTAPLLYLAGESRATDLTAALAADGVRVKTVVVYRAVMMPYPAELCAAFKEGAVDAVLHFSRRSAENYLAGARAAGIVEPALAVRHFCLVPAVAEPLTSAGARHIAVAGRPDEAAMIGLLPAGQA